MPQRRQKLSHRRYALLTFEAALRLGDWGTVLERMSHDKSLNTQYFSGVTPLAFYLGQAKKYDLLGRFLATGPSLDCLSEDGNTIEHILASAVSIHELPVIQAALGKLGRPLDWSVRNKKGETPLDLACAKNRTAGMAHHLLQQGSPVGDTHRAIAGILWQHDEALFRAVLARGVDPLAIHPQRGSLWHILASMPAVFAEKADMLADLGIPQPVMPGIGSPLDVGLQSLSLWQAVDAGPEMATLFRYLQGPPTRVTAYLGFLMADARAGFAELMARYPLGVGAAEFLWSGLLKMDAECLATRGAALLQQGFAPTSAQWPRISQKIKRARVELAPAHVQAWFQAAEHPGQIPWRLRWVCDWGSPALVQAWLQNNGHAALADLTVSTGMLEASPVDSWHTLLKPLCKTTFRLQASGPAYGAVG